MSNLKQPIIAAILIQTQPRVIKTKAVTPPPFLLPTVIYNPVTASSHPTFNVSPNLLADLLRALMQNDNANFTALNYLYGILEGLQNAI